MPKQNCLFYGSMGDFWVKWNKKDRKFPFFEDSKIIDFQSISTHLIMPNKYVRYEWASGRRHDQFDVGGLSEEVWTQEIELIRSDSKVALFS